MDTPPRSLQMSLPSIKVLTTWLLMAIPTLPLPRPTAVLQDPDAGPRMTTPLVVSKMAMPATLLPLIRLSTMLVLLAPSFTVTPPLLASGRPLAFSPIQLPTI